MKKVLIFALLLFMMVFMCSCGAESEEQTMEDSTSKVEETTLAETEPAEPMKTDEEVFSIDTPYCTLKFPAKRKDFVVYDVVSNEDSAQVTFKFNYEGTHIPLYTVSFGEIEDGDFQGTLKTSEGTIDVYLVDLYDAALFDSLSEDKQTIYNQLCMDVNVILSKLYYEEGMEMPQ